MKSYNYNNKKRSRYTIEGELDYVEHLIEGLDQEDTVKKRKTFHGNYRYILKDLLVFSEREYKDYYAEREMEHLVKEEHTTNIMNCNDPKMIWKFMVHESQDTRKNRNVYNVLDCTIFSLKKIIEKDQDNLNLEQVRAITRSIGKYTQWKKKIMELCYSPLAAEYFHPNKEYMKTIKSSVYEEFHKKRGTRFNTTEEIQNEKQEMYELEKELFGNVLLKENVPFSLSV